MDVLIASRRLTAIEALRLGLLNEVVDPAGLRVAVDRLVARMAAASPLAIRAARQTAEQGLGEPLDQVMNARTPSHERLLGSPDAIEGARAFAEKRPPVWIRRDEARRHG
jgi:dehydration protein DpgD